VALHIAQHLNEKLAGRGTHGVTRFVALPHTGTTHTHLDIFFVG
jgi:hypothetical protein